MKYSFTILLFCIISAGKLFAQEGDDSQPVTIEKDSLDAFLGYVSKIRNAVDINDGSFFSENFDTNTIDSILLSVPDIEHKESYRNGVIKGLGSFISKLHFSINNGNYYDFINYSINKQDSTYYALFRYFSHNEGINYHKFIIKPVNNSFVIQDIYIFLTGEYLSSMLSHTFKNTFLNDSEKDSDLYQKFLVLRNMGMDKKAFQVADKIKDSAYINKTFLVLKARAAEAVNDDLHIKCLKDVLERYPGDNSLLLLSLEYYYKTKDFNNLFRSLEDLELYTDDDFLKYYEGTYAYEIGEFQMAKEAFEYMVEEYPSFYSAGFMLLYTYGELNENQEAIHQLNNLVEDGYEKNYLIEVVKTKMNDFYKSSDFKHWKKQR